MKVLIIYLTLLFAAIPTFSQKNTQKSYGSKDFDIKGSKSSEELLERIQNIRNISKEQLLISIKNGWFEGIYYNLLTEELKNDFEIAKELLKKDKISYLFLSDSMLSQNKIIDYLEKDLMTPLIFLPKLALNDYFIQKFLKGKYIDEALPLLFIANSDLRNNKEFIMKIIKNSTDKNATQIMLMCSSNLKKDKEFVKTMMNKNKYSLFFSELNWWKDDELQNIYLNLKEPIMWNIGLTISIPNIPIDLKLKNNLSKEQLIIDIQSGNFNWINYKLLNEQLKNDYEIAGEMIRKYPRSFSILTDSMKSNKSIIDYIEKDFAIYLFYSPQLTTNKNFLENYLEYDPLDYLSLFMANSDLLNNKELIMKIVNKISDKESLLIMAKCSSNLKKDKEFVKKMMYKNKYTVILSELEWWKDDNLVNQFINFKEPGIE